MPTTLFLDRALLPTGWTSNVRLTIEAGQITTVEPNAQPAAGETRHSIALPGAPNLHSHGFQRGMAGLAETRGPTKDSFWTWRDVMYRFVNDLTPEDVTAITAQAYMEMLESGFTRVGEFHYLHHSPTGAPYANPAEMAHSIAAAAQATGIHLTLLPSFYAHGNFGGQPPTQAQRRFVTHPDQFAILLDHSRKAIAPLETATLGIAPHSLRAVTESELKTLIQIAPTGPIHIHIAEQQAEVAACQAHHQTTPIAWLLDHAPIDHRWCLIHATHMTNEESKRLSETAATIALCPITEANLGDGIFPAQTWPGRIGIGTDSNIAITLAGELRQLEYSQRLTHQARNVTAANDPNASTARTLLDQTQASTAALGAPAGRHPAGRHPAGLHPAGLRPNAPADLITLDPNHPSLTARTDNAWLDSWLFATTQSPIDTVYAHGHPVVIAGHHHARDQITRAYRKTLTRLLKAE